MDIVLYCIRSMLILIGLETFLTVYYFYVNDNIIISFFLAFFWFMLLTVVIIGWVFHVRDLRKGIRKNDKLADIFGLSIICRFIKRRR